jgi:formate dehydrogenase subunit gamma
MTANAADVEAICASYGNRPDALIEILHDVQAAAGFISREAMQTVAHALNISRADVYGTLSFYDDFRTSPPAGPRVRLCRAEACQSVGADALAAACEASGIEQTHVYCLGNCALGPAAMVEDRLIGRADADKILSAIRHAKGEG